MTAELKRLGARRVLDLGCGTGRISAALAPFVAKVVAVDGRPDELFDVQRGPAELADLRETRREVVVHLAAAAAANPGLLE